MLNKIIYELLMLMLFYIKYIKNNPQSQLGFCKFFIEIKLAKVFILPQPILYDKSILNFTLYILKSV